MRRFQAWTRVGLPLVSFVVAVVLCLNSASEAAQDESSPGSPAAAAALSDVSLGRQLFVEYGCFACHGTEGQGAPGSGPKLAPDPIPLPAFIAIVRTPPDTMPPYSQKVLADHDLRRMHAFLSSIESRDR